MSWCTTPEITFLRGPVPLSHLLLSRFIGAGDLVVDATCGNGNDTLLLAELVGTSGRVWAFDIQQQAIDATAARLTAAGMLDRVELVGAGHETMGQQCVQPLKAVIFNLGYLPGGDRELITRPESTLAALDQALELLVSGGIVAITIYPGHAGGNSEQSAIESRVARLTPGHWHVWRMGQLNVPSHAPYFILIQKVC